MRALIVALVAVTSSWSPAPTRAADLSGVWEIDRAAWQLQLDRFAQAMLARLPPEVAAQMRASGVDPTAAFKDAAAAGLDSTVEFLPGGVVRTTSPEEGTEDDGRWSLAGDQLRIEVDDADGLEAMVGKVEVDRILLQPVLKTGDPALAFLREMTYPLVRRR